MSIVKYATMVTTEEDIYIFNLGDIAVRTKGLCFINGSDDDRSDFDLMKSRLNTSNSFALCEIISEIIYFYFNKDKFSERSNYSDNQTINVKVSDQDLNSPVKIIITLSSKIENRIELKWIHLQTYREEIENEHY